MNAARLVRLADLAGVALFAAEGAMLALAAGLDLLGILVLAFTTALGGGVVRDVLLGAAPPDALRSWHYPTLAFASGAAVILAHGAVPQFPPMLVTTLDAAGLALFAAAGTQKALLHGMQPFVATLLGTITGVGGGVIRDVLLAHVPQVLNADIYATAAFAGAVVLAAARVSGMSPALSGIAGAAACFTLRMLAVWQRWSLPHPGWL